MLFELNYEFVEEKLALLALNAAYNAPIEKAYEAALKVFGSDDPQYCEAAAVEAVIEDVAASDNARNQAVVDAALNIEQQYLDWLREAETLFYEPGDDFDPDALYG